jgi:hypothetical protein
VIKRYIFLAVLITCQVLTFSCEDDSTPTHSFSLKGPGLYVAGSKNTGTEWPKLFCWKDGEEVILTDGSKHFMISAIGVSGNDVYVTGFQHKDGVSVPVFWKNGVLHSVSKRETAYSSTTDIAVSGEDVYIAFNEGNHAGISVAKYWKNGKVTALSTGTTPEVVTSIFISGDDVYAAGYEEPAGDVPRVVKYWKNGEDFQLTSGEFQAGVTSIFVDGDDVYVTGYEVAYDETTFWPYPIAKYWKNGEEVILGDYNSYANGIEIRENDIYVVGDQFKYVDEVPVTEIKYWKNGESVLMNDIGNCSAGRAMAISQDGNTVYVVGDASRVWVNSMLHSYFNGSQSESVVDICLVEE